jgi:hypothetical protein
MPHLMKYGACLVVIFVYIILERIGGHLGSVGQDSAADFNRRDH